MNSTGEGPELWKRKYEPFSDWRPASTSSKSVLEDPLGEAQRLTESLRKTLEPLAGEAKGKILEMASVVVEVAGKSSNETRSLLAKTLESLAEKIKPK
ncbi:MAG: hypothetical protein HY913_05425 [Desulfomonile tiedjei]|nr:hypothetical protein [Desulfomonile tiedjei]